VQRHLTKHGVEFKAKIRLVNHLSLFLSDSFFFLFCPKYAEVEHVLFHIGQPDFLMVWQDPKLGMDDVKTGPATSIRCAPLRATTR